MGVLKKIKVEDAVGLSLAHDITRIVPGKFKGVGFKNGHVIRKEDIPELLKIGKRSIYIMTLDENQIHEDDAALRIAPAICGKNLRWTDPKEGKSNIVCEMDGLLRVRADALLSLNMIGDIIVSTIKDATPCCKDQIVCGTRIIPLMIDKEKIEALEETARRNGPVLEILPYLKKRVGVLVTGSELYHGLIKDESDTYIGNKLKQYGCWIEKKMVASDDPVMISDALSALKAAGCELIIAHRRAFGGSGRRDPRRRPHGRRRDHLLRRPDPARGHVSQRPAGRGSHHGTACLRLLPQAHGIRSDAAAPAGRGTANRRTDRRDGPWGPVHELRSMPFPGLSLRQVRCNP